MKAPSASPRGTKEATNIKDERVNTPMYPIETPIKQNIKPKNTLLRNDWFLLRLRCLRCHLCRLAALTTTPPTKATHSRGITLSFGTLPSVLRRRCSGVRLFCWDSAARTYVLSYGCSLYYRVWLLLSVSMLASLLLASRGPRRRCVGNRHSDLRRL